MRLHKIILSLGLSMLMVTCQIPFLQSLPAKATSDSTQTKRVIVSLGDSYSSGEGIEPFYGQDVAIPKLPDEEDAETNDLDVLNWLAHRSEKCWAGRLKLSDVSGQMSDHRNENWYFVAASGAEIKHLGVPVTYLNHVEDILSLKREAESHIPKDAVMQNRDFLLSSISSSQIERLKNNWQMERQKKEYFQNYFDNSEGALGQTRLVAGSCYLPYQLEVFDQIGNDSVDYVTMTLSGNDIGFSEIVKKAVFESFTPSIDGLQKNSHYQNQADLPGSNINSAITPNHLTSILNSKLQLFDSEVGYRLMAAYIAVQERAGSNAKLIVAGYPKLLNEEGSAFFSAKASKQVDDCACIFNTKIEQIVEDCRTYGGLNIYFVPVAGSFIGHEAGTHDPYINNVEPLHSQDLDLNAFPPISLYSIHPNEKGAEVYADAVQEKIDELEYNGIVSGRIYENRQNSPVSDVPSRIEKIAAVNYDTGYKKAVYVNQSKNTIFGKRSTNEDDGFAKLDLTYLNPRYYSEDKIYNTGHYEMVLPPGNYQLEISCCDGSLFTLMDANNPEQVAVVEVKARGVIKAQNIYLTEQELGEPCNSYTWELEPSIEADDIYVVDTDEAYLNQACVDKVCDGFGMEGNYDVYDSAVYRIGGTVGLIDYSGKKLETNEKHNMFIIQNGTIDVGYFWESGWPGDPMCCYFYDESTGKITDEWNIPYNGMDTILVGKHDDQWNWKYGLYRNGTPLTSIDYEKGKMNYASNNGVFALCKNGKWGYFDKDGKLILDFTCDSIAYVPNGILGLCVTGYGTDETGTVINEITSDPIYYDVYMASEGYIPVRMDGQWALYDVSGTQVIPAGTFAEIRPVHRGKAWVKDISSGLWGVIRLEPSEQTVNTEPKAQESSVNEDWKLIYREKLRQVLDESKDNYDAAFDLADLNQDGVPELLISLYSSHFAPVDIYSVHNKDLTLIDSIGTYGELQYSPSYNCIAINYAQMGIDGYDIYQIQSNRLISLIHATDNESGFTDTDTDYILNDLTVDKERYYSALAEYGVTSLYDNDGYFSYGRRYTLDWEMIDTILPAGSTPPEHPELTQTYGSSVKELAKMTLPEIIEALGGTYQFHREAIDGCFSIDNPETYPGIEFCVNIPDGWKYSDLKLKQQLEGGMYELELIQVCPEAYCYVADGIRSDAYLSECEEVLGNIDLHITQGYWLSGDASGLGYAFEEDGVTIELNYGVPEFVYNALSKAGQDAIDWETVRKSNPQMLTVHLSVKGVR